MKRLYSGACLASSPHMELSYLHNSRWNWCIIASYLDRLRLLKCVWLGLGPTWSYCFVQYNKRRVCNFVILKLLLVFFVLLLTAVTVMELLTFVRLSPFTANRALSCGVQVLRDGWDWKLLPWLTECSKVSPLSTRFQPVRQFKQGLLIVNNVKVIDVSARLWAALLDDAISCRGRKLLCHSKYRFVSYKDRSYIKLE